MSHLQGCHDPVIFSGASAVFGMKRILTITVAALALLTLAVYAGDYLYLRYRMARKQNPFSTMTVYRYYAVAEKNNKTEFVFDRSESQTCARCIFPHLGYPPCWYLSRRTEQRVNF